MEVEPVNLLAILAMAVATYGVRAAGILLSGRLPRTGRARVALDALPPAVLTAVIAPAVLAGPAEMVAGAVTVLAAFRLPLLPTVIVGVGTVALMRALVG